MADFSDENRNNRSRRREQQLKRIRRQRIIFIVAAVVFLLLLVALLAVMARGSSDVNQEMGMAQALDGATATVAVHAAPLSPDAPADAAPAPAAAPQPAPAPAAPDRLAGKVIAIDAGHAANPDLSEEPTGPGSEATKVKDPGGTSGVLTGTSESVITLAISRYLKNILEAEGATVVMTRDSDTFYGGNRERAEIANQAGADLLVRIHCDGSTNAAKAGVSTLHPASIPGWTDDVYDPSNRAASAVQSALVKGLGAPDQGTVERNDMTGFNWADVPAILPEVGFMSNPEEDLRLNTAEYQQQIARSLARGIEDYLTSA